MFVELVEWNELKQKSLYFKLNNILNLQNTEESSERICGVYAIFNNDNCLYVGQSKNISSRIATHMRGKYNGFKSIHLWDIREIGFGDFEKRSKATQQEVLDNAEKHLMTLLKPIENINIDMDFTLPKEQTPMFESFSTFSISSDGYDLRVTDGYSLLAEEISTGVDYLNACEKIDNEVHKIVKNSINECEPSCYIKELDL